MYSALHTDLYQLTMAQARFLRDGAEPFACFTLSFRTLPFEGGFAVCAGLEPALRFISDWHFSEEDLAYLATLEAPDGSSLFASTYLAHLAEASSQRYSCNVSAIGEGRVVFAGEPLLRITGPVSLCQMLETPLLNIINFSTLIATKSARCKLVAGDDAVLEFGMRRAQGPDGALMASRSAYIGGVDATSNTLAGMRYDIPVAGTHAHSWIMSFPDELEAFRAYVATSPNNAILLVDTYDTIEGVTHAIIVAHEMEARGQRLRGIRIDSGDLAWLSRQARAMLDDAGLDYVIIVASNSLDEYTVRSLKEQGARIDVWGVGTAMVTGGAQSALDGVYKMNAITDADGVWQARMKISDQIAKATLPGIVGVSRFYDEAGMMDGDMVYRLENVACRTGHRDAEGAVTMVDPADVTRRKTFSKHAHFEELLEPVMADGVLLDPALGGKEGLVRARQRRERDLERLDGSHKRFLRPHVYPVGIEESLHEARLNLMRTLREKERA